MKQIIQKIIALATVMIICAAMCLTVYPNPNDICSEECDDDYKDISQ